MGEAFGCSYLYLTAIDAVRSTTKSALLPNPDFPEVRPLRNLDFTEKGRNDTICEEHAEVAQLVEQLIRNQQVVGSSPTFGSIPFRFNPKTPENLRQVVSSSLFHRARPLRARVNQVRYRLSTHFLLRH